MASLTLFHSRPWRESRGVCHLAAGRFSTISTSTIPISCSCFSYTQARRSQWRRHGVDLGVYFYPSFPSSRFSNFLKSVEKPFGGADRIDFRTGKKPPLRKVLLEKVACLKTKRNTKRMIFQESEGRGQKICPQFFRAGDTTGRSRGDLGAFKMYLKSFQKSPCSWFLACLAPPNFLASSICNMLRGPWRSPLTILLKYDFNKMC